MIPIPCPPPGLELLAKRVSVPVLLSALWELAYLVADQGRFAEADDEDVLSQLLLTVQACLRDAKQAPLGERELDAIRFGGLRVVDFGRVRRARAAAVAADNREYETRLQQLGPPDSERRAMATPRAARSDEPARDAPPELKITLEGARSILALLSTEDEDETGHAS